jgi:hypothetical protein
MYKGNENLGIQDEECGIYFSEARLEAMIFALF